MKVYEGRRLRRFGVQVDVVEDGRRRALRHVVHHSPTGFEWGYGGSGPADLALSILTDAAGEPTARTWYQAFKWDVVAQLDREAWELREEEVVGWLAQQRAAAVPRGRGSSD